MGFQNTSIRYACALGIFEKQIKPHYVMNLWKWDVTQLKNGLSVHFFYAKTPQWVYVKVAWYSAQLTRRVTKGKLQSIQTFYSFPERGTWTMQQSQ